MEYNKTNGYLRLAILGIFSASISGCKTISIEHAAYSVGQGLNNAYEFAKNQDWAMIGAVSGAVVGAVACQQDKVLCAVAGAAIGGVVGYIFDERKQRLEALKKTGHIEFDYETISTSNNHNNKDNALVVAVKEPEMFKSGSDRPTSNAKKKFQDLAQVYVEKPQKILVVGHSDASGSDVSNQELSESRAKSVAKILMEAGVPEKNIFFQGAGESRPIATNLTQEGRAKNRRVEIVEIDSEQSMLAYSYDESSNANYLAYAPLTEKEVKVREQADKKPIKPSTKQSLASEQVAIAKVEEPGIKNKSYSSIDFGGQIASSNIDAMYQAIGGSMSNGLSVSLFAKAHADNTQPQLSCHLDAPRKPGEIKRLDGKVLKDGSEYHTADFFPGMNMSTWTGNVNGHLVGITPIAVLRSNGSAIVNPSVVIYQDIDQKGMKADPDFIIKNTVVNAYNGRDGVFYRVFVEEKSSPVSCFDLALPKSGSAFQAKDGHLIYKQGSSFMSAVYTPARLRKI